MTVKGVESVLCGMLMPPDCVSRPLFPLHGNLWAL